MIQKYSLFFLLFFYSALFFSQQKDAQLYQYLTQIKQWIDEGNPEAEKSLKKIEKLVEKEGSDSIKGLLYRTYYNFYTSSLDNDNAMKYIDKSISAYQRAKYAKGETLSRMNKGNLFLKKADFKNAVGNYLTALSLAQQKNLEKEKGLLLKNLGVAFYNQNKLDEALDYAQKSLAVFTKLKMQKEIAAQLSNIGNVHYAKFENKKGLEYYNKALQISEKVKDSVQLAKLYNNIGAILYENKIDSVKALQYVVKSLDIKKKIGDPDAIMFQYSSVANLYANQGLYDEAKKYLDVAFEMAKKSGNTEELKEIYSIYSIIYYGKKDFKKAVDYERLFAKYKDSLLSIENSKTVDELNTKYKTAEKDKEILQNKNQLYRRNVYIFSLGALFLAGLAVAFSIFRHRKKNEKIKIQKEILHQQDLATKAVMKAEDNERKRMATHLHDGVAQLLGAANMNVEALGDFRDDDTAFDKILEKTKNILDDAITDVRGLSHQMMPNMLIKSSLGNALQDLIEKSNSPKLHINLKLDGLQEDLDKNIQVVIYRIIQECINNTIKHAQASKIDISVKQNTKEVETEISDNGVGFNTNEVSSKSSGLGLGNIKSRIDMMKGKFEIVSSKNTGTKINVKIPLNQ